jgi:ParB family transcriptional regulator, chromosome partitioning protein
MLSTLRYEYLGIDAIRLHPAIHNHRPLNMAKVAHYRDDILENGLLEPLIVWEKSFGVVYLVGGFHRMAAIRAIREDHPGYFDRVDVRVVAGDEDEMRALNLKLNADRVDATVADAFDTVVYLCRAGWSADRISVFLDRPTALIREIIALVPAMPSRVRAMIENKTISWNRARSICRALMAAPADQEQALLERLLAAPARRKPLTFKNAKAGLSRHFEKYPQASFELSLNDLLALLMVLEGKKYTDEHLERVQELFPEMLE